MIDKVDVKKVVTRGDRVLINIKKMPKMTDSGILLGDSNEFGSSRLNIDNYIGEITQIGDEEEVHKLAPGIKEGEYAMFSQFAGYHIPTEKHIFAKVIHSHDIHCKVKNPMKFEKEDVTPTGARLLLEIVKPGDTTESGIFVGEKEGDPRELDTDKCIVLGVGPQVNEFEVGDTVFIPGYVGNNIVTNSGQELKTVNFNDVLFKIEA